MKCQSNINVLMLEQDQKYFVSEVLGLAFTCPVNLDMSYVWA